MENSFELNKKVQFVNRLNNLEFMQERCATPLNFELTKLANSSAIRFRILQLRLESSISSVVANFASTCKYHRWAWIANSL